MASKNYVITEKQEDGSLLELHPVTKSKNVIESDEKQFISKEKKEKLEGIESGAEVNTVESISINGGEKIYPDEEKNIDLTIEITSGLKLTYEAATGVISLVDNDNNILSSVDLPLELLIESGTYNSATQNIELVLANGQKILIPAGDLVDEYGADGTTITMSNTNTFSIAQAVLNRITALENQIGNVGTPGTYSVVVTDAKGRVIQGGQLIEIGTTGQTEPSANLVVGGLFFQEISE